MNTPSDSFQPGRRPHEPEALDEVHRALAALTPRQREVLMLLGEGLRPAEIGRALHVSKNTVAFHLKHVMRKLGLRSRRELLVRAVLLRRPTDDVHPRPPSGGEPNPDRR